MPQTQHVKKSTKSSNKGKGKALYRTLQIGEDLVLETKLAKDGTLIFRVSPLGEHRKGDRVFITSRPGQWMGVHKLHIGKMFDHLVELEKQAQDIQLYMEADHTPLRHHPFAGFDFGAVLIEGVEEALNPSMQKRVSKSKSRPKQKQKQKPRSKQKKQPQRLRTRPRNRKTEDILRRMDWLSHTFKVTGEKLRALHTEG